MSAEAHDELAYLAEGAHGEADDCCERGREQAIRLALPASALTAWQIKDAMAGLTVVGFVLGLARLPFASFVSEFALFVICLLFAAPTALDILVLNPARYRRYSLYLYPQRLVLSQGWVFRQVVTIPRGSVLNLRFRQGPVLRRLGLTSVSVLTIADHQKIGPLDASQVRLVEGFVNGDLREVLA